MWRTDLGYRVCNQKGQGGIALKKLPTPLTGKATLRAKFRPGLAEVAQRNRINGFLVFGSSPDQSDLVTCGVLVKAKRATITEGKNRASKPVAADFGKEQEIAVTIDIPSGQVTMTVGKQKVALKLKQPLKSVAYAGYCVQGAVSDFGLVEVTEE